ncbi:hypothetical protein KBZ21_10445 [Streptomyces sp. A73]|uniref:hypothetical protein n=1 Tax=Streptomyces sp. RK75 TaxID=2824895 RepID=UPI001607E5DD|nr:hypothetical protein [Streptomyces sp. RK75]MBQ0866679.1 hypothetical protein [Streptomyces sp. RK75]MBQ1158557.1 hypothetical protein [Streptomyces sp. A73]
MRVSRPSHTAAAATCVTVLAVAVTGCSLAEKVTTGLKVKHAFEKLGEQPAASVLVSVDGNRAEAEKFLRAAGADDDSSTRQAARLLTRGELTFAVGSDREETPLKELSRSERLRFATALNFGGRDVLAAKSVEEKLYVRMNLRSLVAQTGGSAADRQRARTIVALAKDLPTSLGSAKDALKGKWVEIDPEAFDDFARAARQIAAEEKRGEKKGEFGRHHRGAAGAGGSEQSDETSKRLSRATAAGRALNGESEREFLEGLEKTLGEHARFRKAGEYGGAEHVTVSMPARRAAPDLSRALEALGARLDPSTVPDKTVSADLQIRRGQLTGLTVDLGQFLSGKQAEKVDLPLRMVFGSGDAVTVQAPDGARELKPQDLMAAVMYGALGTGGI